MPSPTRITIPLSSDSIQRLKTLAAGHDLSLAKFIACLLAQSDDEIAEVVALHAPAILQRRANTREQLTMKRREARKALKDMSVEELEAILKMRNKEAQ